MKTIAVFFDKPGFDEYPFDVEEYRIAYHQIARLMDEKGARLCIVRDQNSFLGNNTFSHGWCFDGTTFVEQAEPLQSDVVYDKGHFSSDETTRLSNDPALVDLCGDKWKTCQLFPELCCKTFLVHDEVELTRALDAFNDELIVAKPQYGEEGKGVIIGTSDEVRAEITSFPYLIQEFIDTTGGIPGIVDGPHDFRIICINGDIGVSYIRTPPEGQLRANVAQGGKEIEVLPENIPEGALQVFRTVDAYMQDLFPSRIYSVDMGRSKSGKWQIIELNAKPALSLAEQGPSYPRYQRLLCDALVKVAQKDSTS